MTREVWCLSNASYHHHLVNMLFLFIILTLLRGRECNVEYVEPPLGMTKYFHLAPPMFYLIFISPMLNHLIRDDKILSSCLAFDLPHFAPCKFFPIPKRAWGYNPTPHQSLQERDWVDTQIDTPLCSGIIPKKQPFFPLYNIVHARTRDGVYSFTCLFKKWYNIK